MEVDGQRHAPAAVPRERLGTHCIGDWPTDIDVRIISQYVIQWLTAAVRFRLFGVCMKAGTGSSLCDSQAVGSSNTARSLDKVGDRGLMTISPTSWMWSRE
jgi:hypothetical protein